MADEVPPVLLVDGVLGWGNPGAGALVHQLDTYGPGGRWHRDGRKGPAGEKLADALVDAGAHEGSHLLVLAVPRQPNQVQLTSRLREAVQHAVAVVVSDWTS